MPSACLQDEVTFKGVVFNEMKGVYSSPDSVNMRAVQQSLFPDNTYGKDSGGDPRVIPDLTFEEFQVSLRLCLAGCVLSILMGCLGLQVCLHLPGDTCLQHHTCQQD